MSSIDRRRFVAGSTAALTGLLAGAAPMPECFQAMGTRVGDVRANSAVIWTRITRNAERLKDGVVIPGRANGRKEIPEPTVPVDQLEGACPGAEGEVRVRYGLNADFSDTTFTPWAKVTAEGDYIHQFRIGDLQPGQLYHYGVEVRPRPGAASVEHFGTFHTAPLAAVETPVRFCVMTCQGYPDRGHPDGHPIYPSMLALRPHFTSLTGDLVYYDNDLPVATTVELARYHWQRMFSLPRLAQFNSHVATYWLKDDHDTLKNDTWPGTKQKLLTFTEGQEIFRQQAPMEPGKSYRTFRWGKDLQIWLSEGRDDRSPNNTADGPQKTIWGTEQKDWFKRTVLESNATWKVLISPTPLVGPDRGNKNDNHSNAGFEHEGRELREWIQNYAADNLFVICGDRHWQYHSVHPETGLNEFSVGAASDEHAGGSPGEDPKIHKFHRVKGGFLSVDVAGKSITFNHHDVAGKVVYTWTSQA